MKQPTVAIIGSGFSGLCAAIQLRKKLNIRAQVYEQKDDIGGVWNTNTYPGCACDVESHLYCFNWTYKYNPRENIQKYMKEVAQKYQLYNQIQFNTQVIKAEWKEDRKQWEIEFSLSNQSTETKWFDFIEKVPLTFPFFFFSIRFFGVGAFGIPHIPEQFKSFEGKIVHSGEWDQQYDYTDKKMAVIGSGTSAIQIVTHLAPITKHLYSFQRSPAWILPAVQVEYPVYLQWLFAYVPFFMMLYRLYLFLRRDLLIYYSFKHAGSSMAQRRQHMAESYMKNELIKHGRKDLIDKLIPTYTLGCKRLGVSDHYLASLCRDDVTVVTSPVFRVEGKTIKTEDGQAVEIDVLCLATGFKVHHAFGNLQVYGRYGVHLNDIWDQGVAKTYKTVNVHQFPNLFMLLGPGSSLGHSSVISIIEGQVNYSVEMIRYMMQHGIQSLDATEEAQEAYWLKTNQGFKGTVWNTACASWYKKDGEIRALWPYSVMSFFSMLKDTAFRRDYTSA
ncbi:hypothetical protein BD560DRAFT_467792 [Blakeslea trispora]|nr:hypothetical protein BD560DRAFT_467792 [Blakeslea trispora]